MWLQTAVILLVGVLIAPGRTPAEPSPGADPSPQAGDALQTWTASGGEARWQLRADFLPDFGLEVLEHERVVRDLVDAQHLLGDRDHLVLEAPYGNFERFLYGAVHLDSPWRLRHQGREVALAGLTLTPGILENGHPSLEARDSEGRHLLTLGHLHIQAEHWRGLLTVHNADVVATRQLAELLGLDALADLPIGMAWLDLELRIPEGSDTSGRGLSCEGRPFWPQAGHEVDIAMVAITTVAYQGTDSVTGRIKVAPSATLKNVSQGDVPWIPKFQTLGGGHSYPYTPPDQHPFLVWNMYRISGGRIEQLGGSGVKHAFLTLNFNCTINCGNSNILWPGCEDIYSAGTNDSNFNQGPREDVEASLGLFWSTCSFFDPGCTGSQTQSSTAYQNRLMVDPGELQTPGAEYFLDAWYVVQYDVDIFNSMAYRRLTPAPSGGAWTFSPLGPFTLGRVIDQWVPLGDPAPLADHVAVVVPSATPGAPYPNNMPQGHINVLARVTEPEPGRFRYHYAVQNFDFERGVEAFRIPIAEETAVFDTWFRDLDEDPLNDWVVTIADGLVSFEAPASNPLPWFTLFNFEIEVDAPPIASQVTLDLGAGAVAPDLQVEILGPLVFDPYIFFDGFESGDMGAWSHAAP
jgi:hypothetical protein